MNKMNKMDMVIIFFAGHGATEKDVMSPDGDGLEKYLLPYDADTKDLYASAMPMREISHIFHRIRSERLIFIVDSCYSGASGGRTISSTGIRANISDAFLERIVSGKGRIILTASGPNEVSAENNELKHGVFTYFLLQGLRGMADMDKEGEKYLNPYESHKQTAATGRENKYITESVARVLVSSDVDIKNFFKGLSKITSLAASKINSEEEIKMLAAQNENIKKENASLSSNIKELNTKLKKEMERSVKAAALFQQLIKVNSAFSDTKDIEGIAGLGEWLKEARGSADAL